MLTRRQAAELLDRFGLRPSRALGQNFLVDPNTIERIVRFARVGPDDRVAEIGAGLGSLTLGLARSGAFVRAIETDRHLLPVLDEVLAQTGVEVTHADATEVDWADLLDAAPGWVVVANLPYNVGTTIVLDLLEHAPMVDRLLVMVQQEVAERLAAGPGSPAYGIPSVLVSYWAEAEVVGRVGPDVFLPRPKVASALVELRRRPEPPVDADAEIMFALVRAAFGQRRKMLRRSLAALVEPDDFAAAGVDPRRRPEEIDLDGWAALSRAARSAQGES